MRTRKKTYFQFSLILILLLDLLNSSFFSSFFILKFFSNSLIYISFFFLPFKYFSFLKFRLKKNILVFFYLILLYGVLNILRHLNNNEIFSLLGNPYYGPSFLIPFYFILSDEINILYWLNKISLICIKLGMLIISFSFFFNIKLPLILFFPTFFILLNYNYVNKADKVWIILSLVFGIFIFVSGDNSSRTAVIRILLSIIIFAIIYIDLRWIYKAFILLLLLIPSYGLFIGLKSGESIFNKVSSINKDSADIITTDTRTFLYSEVYLDLKKTNSLFFGKGPLGTYFSEYFYNWEGSNGDYYIRHNVEVGILHYLLKGGLIYLFLFFSIMILAIINALDRPNNKYIISLGLVLCSFLLVSFIENIPSYSFYFASIWIITGICSSNKIKNFNDNQIKFLIQNRISKRKHYSNLFFK